MLLLLEKGADPRTKDVVGQTPLSRAKGKGHEVVMRLLETRLQTSHLPLGPEALLLNQGQSMELLALFALPHR